MKDEKKEMATLKLLAEGHTERRMAAILGISHKTVEQRIKAIRLKFGAKNSSHLIAIAFRKKLIQ